MGRVSNKRKNIDLNYTEKQGFSLQKRLNSFPRCRVVIFYLYVVSHLADRMPAPPCFVPEARLENSHFGRKIASRCAISWNISNQHERIEIFMEYLKLLWNSLSRGKKILVNIITKRHSTILHMDCVDSQPNWLGVAKILQVHRKFTWKETPGSYNMIVGVKNPCGSPMNQKPNYKGTPIKSPSSADGKYFLSISSQRPLKPPWQWGKNGE